MRPFRLSTNAEAIVWVTASTALFSITFASGKFAGDLATPFQILFLRYVGGLMTLIGVVHLGPSRLVDHRSLRPLSHLGRAISGAFGGVAAIYAAANMPLVDATAIGLLQAVFLIVLGMIILKETIHGVHWVGIFICCVGAALMVGSKGAFTSFGMDYLVPAAVALVGAFLIGFEGILIKKLSMADRSMTVLLHSNTFGLLLMSIPAYLTWQSTSWVENLPFLLLGPLSVTAQYFTIRGYRIADVSILGSVDYTWLIFAAIIGYVFFSEVPTLTAVIGSVVIVVGGILLAQEKRPCLDSDV